MGLGRKGLEALFRAEVGTTPQLLYKTLRLREARRLATHTKQSIPEIATRCGYADASAMSRAFRQEFGCTPSSLRNG